MHQRVDHALYAAILSTYEWGTVDESGDFPDWDDPEDYDWDDEDWDDEQIARRASLDPSLTLRRAGCPLRSG